MKLFFNYRREDTDDLAGRLHDRLSVEFGAENIFKDVDSIRPGQNWRVALEQSVASCDIVLAIIGRHWLTITDSAGQRRIDAEEDFVRFELEAARRSGKVVMPVIVKGATVPNQKLLPESIRWLSDFQQVELRADPFFKDDVARLLAELVRIRDRLKDQQTRAVPTGGPVRPGAADAAGVIRCGSCHAQCDRADQFCQVCGAALWAACPSCDLPVPQNQVFCSGCGANLPKLRELIELTDKNEKRFSKIASITDPSERMTSLDILTREIDAAIRILPKHTPLERLKFQVAEVYRNSARDVADAVYASGKLQEARDHYLTLRQIDPLSDHASARLSEIEARYNLDVAECRECIAKGDFRRAVERLNRLCDSFPSDAKLQAELVRCQGVVARLSRLIPDGLRELKRHRQFIGLEKELLWLRQEKIPVRNLDAWLNEVKGVIRKANDDFLKAQSELREGHFRQTRKLANEILKSVSDHAGAKELLAATGGTEEMIARLDALLKRQQFCAAQQLVNSLEQKNIADPRFTRLAAKTKVEIGSLDSSIRIILILFGLSCFPGYFIGGKFYELMKLGQIGEDGLFRGLLWLFTVLAIPTFVVAVIFLSTSHRGERIVRFLFDWLPFGRILRKSDARDDSVQELKNDVEAEAASNEAASDSQHTAERAPVFVSPAFVNPPPAGKLREDDTERDAAPNFKVFDKPDPILFQTVDLDRCAALVEMLSVGVMVFCLSVACGHSFWGWLLGLRFNIEDSSDARTLEILSPFSAVFPLLAMSLMAVAMEPATRWQRMLLVGACGILFEFLAAILIPSKAATIHILLLAMIVVLTIAEMRRVPFWRVLLMQAGGLLGASLVLSAVAVPLMALVAVFDFSEHSIPASSFVELTMTAFFVCQLFVSVASPGSVQISRLAADHPAVRGTLAIGSAWAAAATLSLIVGWLTFTLKEEWHGAGQWVLLLLFAQTLPFVLSGSQGRSALRPWLVLSATSIIIMSVLWWLLPAAAILLFPATFAVSVVGLLRLETTNLFEQGANLAIQLKLRHSRRMFRLKQWLRRV